MKSLLNCLRDPLIDGIDIDSKDRLIVHREVLERKRLLQEVFTEFHHNFDKLDQQFFTGDGLKIELGAGIKPIRDSYPDVLMTDVVDSPHLDFVLDAEDMNLKNDSVRVLFGQNCFHHFPHPDRFFKEANRVLTPGGGIILLEPYYGPIAKILFKRLFKTEGFDKDFPSWETPITGPMNGANQALSYIVFVRDKIRFERKYPTLKIVHFELCNNYLKYLISGGLNFRQLLPNWMSPLIHFAQCLLFPFNRWLSLHHVIIIKKVEE